MLCIFKIKITQAFKIGKNLLCNNEEYYASIGLHNCRLKSYGTRYPISIIDKNYLSVYSDSAEPRFITIGGLQHILKQADENIYGKYEILYRIELKSKRDLRKIKQNNNYVLVSERDFEFLGSVIKSYSISWDIEGEKT